MQSILKNNLGQSRIIKVQNIFLKTGFFKKSFEQIFFKNTLLETCVYKLLAVT